MALRLTQLGPTQTITVSTTAIGLTDGAAVRGATHLMLYSTDKIRFTSTATFPTSTAGMFIGATSYLSWLDPNFDYRDMIKNLRMIKDTGAAGDSTVEAMLFKASV